MIAFPHLALQNLILSGRVIHSIVDAMTTLLLLGFFISTISHNRTISQSLADILILTFGILYIIIPEKNFFQNESSRVLLSSVAAYFVLSVLLNKIEYRKAAYYFNISILCSLIIQLIFFILQFAKILTNPNRNFDVGGSFGHPGYTLGVLSLGILVVASNINVKNQSRIFNYTFYSCIVLVLFFSVHVLARASIIVLCISIAIVCIKKNVKWIDFTFEKLWLPVLLSILLGGYLIFLKIDSTKGRLFIWKNSIHLIMERPLLGHGPDSFSQVYNTFQVNYFRSGFGNEQEKETADFVILAYNDFLETGVEIGLIGLLILLSIFTTFILQSYTKIHLRKNIIPLLGFVIFMCTWGILQEQVYSNLLFSVLAFWRTAIQQDSNTINKISRQTRVANFSMSSIILVLLLSATVSQFTQVGGYYFKLKGDTEYRNKRYPIALENYKRALNWRGVDVNLILRYAEVLHVNKRESLCFLQNASSYCFHPDIELSLGRLFQSTGQYDSAIAHYENVHYLSPSKFRPLYLIAKINFARENLKVADSIAHLIINKNPKFNTPEIMLMKEDMKIQLEER